jgi:hypothetical protein
VHGVWRLLLELGNSGAQHALACAVHVPCSLPLPSSFTLVDTSNAAIADLPPHGHASDAALKHAPIVIGKFIAELAQWELETVALMCGQGLVEHVDHLDAELKAGRPGLFEPIEQMLVYASSSTHASQAAGASADVYNRRAMEAMMARLGL